MPPIKPGTAARLGLRPARPRHNPLLLSLGSLGPEQAEEFCRRWEEANRGPIRVIQRDPPSDKSWLQLEERPQRRWFRRR